MRRLAILGAGGHGKVVAETAEAAGWNQVVFYDDTLPVNIGGEFSPVFGDSLVLISQLEEFDGVVVAVGDNHIRSLKQNELSVAGANLISLQHPSAIISNQSSVEPGSVIFANAVINASARIGSGSIINTGAVVEHDCSIGDFCHIGPGAILAGGVVMKDFCFVGAGAAVKPKVMFGESSIAGVGSVVINNVPAGEVVIGNPARVIS